MKSARRIASALTASFLALPIGLGIFTRFSNYYFVITEGVSMQPTLNPFYPSSKDILLVKKPTGPVINEIQKNSIITFKIADRDFIKRITGLPGDLVSFKADQNSDFEVPEGNLWLLGDNQGASMDSTRLGPVILKFENYSLYMLLHE